jgi:hypothetical protein
MSNYTFAEGCMWEGGEWEIRLNEQCSGFGGGVPCKHCVDDRTVDKPNAYGGTYKERLWTCPAVVVAMNEGGHNSTGVCLDCLLEAACEVKR